MIQLIICHLENKTYFCIYSINNFLNQPYKNTIKRNGREERTNERIG